MNGSSRLQPIEVLGEGDGEDYSTAVGILRGTDFTSRTMTAVQLAFHANISTRTVRTIVNTAELSPRG